MIIRTKIIATTGPSSGDAATLRQLAEAGCDVFRINFSHGDEPQREEFLRNIRGVEQALGTPLAVMADLCGPKIRVGKIEGGSVLLGEGRQIVIQRQALTGRADRVSTTLDELIDAARVGQTILVDDGRIRLVVEQAGGGEEIVCRVLRGGMLAGGKGVNLPQTDLKLSALTDKDRRDVAWIAQRDFDYVALSFVRRAEDVRELADLLRQAGCGAHVVAKIEKPQALERIESIIEAADAVMVARGDLGVEMDLPAVPVAQKNITRLCGRAGKPCIIATQMLESMTQAEVPTRAEVSDVANAVLDHADAVMLSGETAVGKYPVAAVAMMNEIVAHVQAYDDEHGEPPPVVCGAAPTTAALAGAVREILRAEKIAAVAVFTATGTTARMLAKNRLPCPVLALSPSAATARRTCLYYGVQAVQAAPPAHTGALLDLASRAMVERGIARAGDRIIVLTGHPIGQAGATNALVVHTVSG